MNRTGPLQNSATEPAMIESAFKLYREGKDSGFDDVCGIEEGPEGLCYDAEDESKDL